MKCLILFSWKIKKNIINLSSAEFAQSVLLAVTVCLISQPTKVIGGIILSQDCV